MVIVDTRQRKVLNCLKIYVISRREQLHVFIGRLSTGILCEGRIKLTFKSSIFSDHIISVRVFLWVRFK